MELNNDYPFAPIKQKSKERCCPSINFKNVDLNNIPIENVKKLVANLFDKEKYVIYYEKFNIYLMLGLKLKKYILYQNSINHDD